MAIEKEPFRRYDLDGGKADIVNLRLNAEERAVLEEGKKVLEQAKDSTALKQLAAIGAAVVLHDKKTRLILEMVFKNKRRNRRTGILDFE